MTRLRVGVIGLSTTGRHDARVLGSTDRVDIVGPSTQSALRIGPPPGLQPDLDLQSLIEWDMDPAIAKPEPLEVDLTALRDAALGRDGEIVTGQDGLHALQVAEAILRSAQQNTVEKIL